MMLLIETTARVTVIVLLSLAYAALLRRRAAAVRHWILAMGLSCAGVMPPLQAATPSWSMPSASVQTLVSTAAAAQAASTRRGSASLLGSPSYRAASF